MNVYVWRRIKEATYNYHSEGGVVVFAESQTRAIELAKDAGAHIQEDEKPNEVRSVGQGEEAVYIMPDAGCC